MKYLGHSAIHGKHARRAQDAADAESFFLLSVVVLCMSFDSRDEIRDKFFGSLFGRCTCFGFFRHPFCDDDTAKDGER
jgi:hypothetical protein